MATLSPARAGVPLLRGLKLVRRGKVRDTYELPEDKLLVVATDAISIFDFILNALVLGKGVILNAMNHFWSKHLEQFGFKTDLVSAGAAIEEYLPSHLRGNVDLQSRVTVVKKLDIVPKEFVFRAAITGTALRDYMEGLLVCGHQLPLLLQDGDELPYVLDTPTTKSDDGHDEGLPAREVRGEYPHQTILGLQMFSVAASLARKRGIVLADSKLEFGVCHTVADEKFTPDSSRFWEFSDWQRGRIKPEGRKAPSPYDKQIVRDEGVKLGINKLDPKNPDHVKQVHSMNFAQELLDQTTKVYRYIFWRLAGLTIEKYLQTKMGVQVPDRKGKSIAIICGSKSDVPAVQAVRDRALFTMADFTKVETHVMSCHRNPNELRDFAREKCAGLDAIICAGSKAFALPGVLDAHLQAAGIFVPVIGVALGEQGSLALEAAKLSIEEIPDQPVLMNEITGKCWVGTEGLTNAMMRVARGELPPLKPHVQKPVEMNVLG